MVAVSSSDRARKCWDPLGGDSKVAAAVQQLLRRHRIERSPVYALGASSGGAMALMLPYQAAELPEPLQIKARSGAGGRRPVRPRPAGLLRS